MSQQKALFLQSKQGEWVVGSKEIPTPQAGEVLVKIQATALNPVDWKIQKYGLFLTEFPAVIGSDSAGTVESVGEGVTGLVKGDRVIHQGTFTNNYATFQQYATIPAVIAAKIPEKLSFDEAASIPAGLATATMGLYQQKDGVGAGLVSPWDEGGKGKYNGKPIVILGGSGSVGQFVIQVAKISGFSPIITTASSRNAAYLKSLGATHVVDRNSNVGVEVGKITSAPIEVVYDAVSAEDTQNIGWDILASTGRLILVLPAVVDKSKYKEKSIVQVMGSPHADLEFGKHLYIYLASALSKGIIVPNRVEVLPGGLQGIKGGLEKMENGDYSGVKLVVRPQETA